jgi:hypothetical protein
MPVTMKVGQKVPFYVIGVDANGVRTATLGTGQNIRATGSSQISITPDASPANAPDGGPSLASGVITALSAGSASIEADLVNADGSIAASATDVISISAVVPVPGPATALSLAFGTPA